MSKSSILLRVLLLLCPLTPSVILCQNSQTNSSIGGIPFTFNLTSSAKTSAGVYKPDSTLVRILWSGEQKNAGSNTASWDGKDDAGNLVADGNYNIQVLSNNLTYSWDGVIANTSTDNVSDHVHHSNGGGRFDMQIVNGKAFYAVEYNEGYASEFYFNTNNIQRKENLWNSWPRGKTGLVSSHLCTDGTNVYFGGVTTDNFNSPTSFVYARKVTDNSIITFSSGVSQSTAAGSVIYQSAIDVVNTSPIYRVSGMAVQKSGNYLFVARRQLNSVHVLNKATGALVQSLTVTAPKGMCVDGTGNLWIVTGTEVKKYTVNSNGTITNILTLTGLVQPLCVQVTPDGSKVYVADAGNSQQVKIFNNSTGAFISTFGQLGGYAGNPTVTNDKFMFAAGNDFSYSYVLYNIASSICFDTDGSWWITDAGTLRMLHYSASNAFIEQIHFVGYNFSVSIDQNNPTRVFSNYLEYEIDYSKPLLPNNGSWKLKRNWAANITEATDGQFKRLSSLTTLSNGRTYALNNIPNNQYNLIELADTGIRTIAAYSQTTALEKNGNLTIFNRGSSTPADPTTWKRRTFTGFDANNNPIWSAPVTIASVSSGNDYPLNGGSSFRHSQLTNSGVVFFNDENSPSYHLGGIKFNSNTWRWRVAPATFHEYKGELPLDGYADIGNGVVNPFGGMVAMDNLIIWNYKGENWKGGQQTKFYVYNIEGLLLGTFGENAGPPGSEPVYGGAGNVQNPIIGKVGNDYYLYHNDEFFHGAVHRWKIGGLNTIAVQSVQIVKSGTPLPPVYDYTDLMAGLPFNDTLTNNTAGWTRFAPESGRFNVKTKYGTYKKSENDLRIYSIGQNVDCWVRRELGNNTGLVNWKITGDMAYPEAGENGDNFVDIVDANNKVIVRLSRPEYYPNLEVKANSNRIAFGSDVYATVGRLLPLSIVASNGSITVSFGNYPPVTVSPLDPQADISSPRLMQLYTVSNPSGHQINIARLKFYKNFGLVPGHFRSKTSGLWKNTGSWESSADSSTWNDATTVPDFNTTSILIRNNHTITLSDTVAVDQLTVQNNGTLRIAPTALLTINDGTGDDIKIEGAGVMLVQSDATGTGRIGNSAGTVSGNVTVERYISSAGNKAYRLLAPTTNTVNGPKPFIRNNWQEGQNNMSMMGNSNNVPNYGIHITGSIMGANGFDATLTGTASLMYYNQAAANPAWMAVPNTDATNFDVKKGYLVYIRGDRGTDLHGNTNSSATTLRTTGTIATGTQNFTAQEGNGRSSLVTNPYPCPVDWATIYKDPTTGNADKFESYYTYWDPNVGLSGGYVTVYADGTKSAATNATTEIQPGQAFFIKAKPGVASATFVVKEAHKSRSSNGDVFRTGAREQFRTSLYFYDADGNRKMADGVTAVFDTAFSMGADGNDAEEMANWDENIAIKKWDKMISIESRPLIEDRDTIQLSVQRLRMQRYEWQFDPNNFSSPGLWAYLEDKLTNVRTQISLTNTSIITFTVNMIPGSSASDRFRIIFTTNNSLPVTLLSLKAYQKGAGNQVEWKTGGELNIDRYEVEKSVDGRIFTKAGTLQSTSGNLSNTYTWLDGQPAQGNNYYRIKTVDKNGQVTYSTIVNVKIGGKTEGFEVYPNPIKGNLIVIRFANIKRGSYTINLVNAMGQKVVSKTMEHGGGSGSQSVLIDNSLPSGTYNLQIVGNGTSFNKKIIR